MVQKIRKLVIPVAGIGTRFLPATKASPKEMLPIVDKPIIQYLVEGAVASGIEEIILVTGHTKRAIEDHFDRNFELEYILKQRGKEDLLKEVKKLSKMAKFIFVRQGPPKGNGHAVLCAEPVVDDESFAAMYGDDVIYSEPPILKQLMDVYEEFGHSVLNCIRTKKEEDANKFGFVKGPVVRDNIYRVEEVIEKPGPDKVPSDIASIGAFILTPRIFSILKDLEPGKGGEIWLPDAINKLAHEEPVYACVVENSKYYNCGDKLEYIKANIDFALAREEFRDGLIKHIRDLEILK